MMNKNGLPHSITVFSVAILVILVQACFSTPPINPMTREVARDIEENGYSIDGFRFMVSTNVTLTFVDRNIVTLDNRGRETEEAGTTVRETVVRNIINLNANTRGRLLSGNVNTGLNVYFEEFPDRKPTLTFVEKSGPGDRFYFKYEDHPTLANVVRYENVLYQVTWRGNEEPYLLYERIQRERTNTRTMRGVN